MFYVIHSPGQFLTGAALAELPEGAFRDGSAQAGHQQSRLKGEAIVVDIKPPVQQLIHKK